MNLEAPDTRWTALLLAAESTEPETEEEYASLAQVVELLLAAGAEVGLRLFPTVPRSPDTAPVSPVRLLIRVRLSRIILDYPGLSEIISGTILGNPTGLMKSDLERQWTIPASYGWDGIPFYTCVPLSLSRSARQARWRRACTRTPVRCGTAAPPFRNDCTKEHTTSLATIDAAGREVNLQMFVVDAHRPRVATAVV